MLRRLASTLCTLGIMLTLSACSRDSASNGELNILTWDGYIPQDIISEFEQQENIKINISNFDTNEEMLAKISTGNSGYDLVIGSDYIIDIARKQDLLQELDKTQIPNYSNLNKDFLSKSYDPENEFTVPYSVGSPVILYDPGKIDIEINSYNDLWDPALEGKLLLIDDARNIVGITLKSLGYSMNTTDEAKLKEAEKKLMGLKDNIHHLDYNNPHESLISGEVDIAYLFTSQAFLALDARPELKAVYSEDGIGFGIDAWFVPKEAQNFDNAHKFLNFITDPQIGARITEQIMYPTPNKAAHDLLPDELKNNVVFNIPGDKLKDAEFIQDIGDKAELYTKIWTEFKK